MVFEPGMLEHLLEKLARASGSTSLQLVSRAGHAQEYMRPVPDTR